MQLKTAVSVRKILRWRGSSSPLPVLSLSPFSVSIAQLLYSASNRPSRNHRSCGTWTCHFSAERHGDKTFWVNDSFRGSGTKLLARLATSWTTTSRPSQQGSLVHLIDWSPWWRMGVARRKPGCLSVSRSSNSYKLSIIERNVGRVETTLDRAMWLIVASVTCAIRCKVICILKRC